MEAAIDGATVFNGASIATAFFNHQIGSGQNTVAKDFLASGREVGPIAGLRRRPLRNNASNHLVPLPEFHSLSRPQPSLQALGVPKLANVYAGHNQIVPQSVPHCQIRFLGYLTTASGQLPPAPVPYI